MERVVFVASPFAQPHEFCGIDGEIYTIRPNAKLILPRLNAEILAKNNQGIIVSDYQEPKDVFDEYLDNQVDPYSLLKGEEDPVKEWAKWAYQQELKKPNPDIDRLWELRLLSQGKNPAEILYKIHDTKTPNEITIDLSKSPNINRDSKPQSPTGLCSLNINSTEPHYLGKPKFEYKGEMIKLALDTFLFKCVTTLQAFSLKGLNSVVDDSFVIFDYDYTRCEPHEELLKTLDKMGYDVERDFYVSMLFEKFECSEHGDVIKPCIDYEKHFTEEGGRLRLFAGRLHPLNKMNVVKKAAQIRLEQLKYVVKAVENKTVSYRFFDGELKKVRHNKHNLALIWFVFTLPKSLSVDMADYILRSNDKLKAVNEISRELRKAVKNTIRRFLEDYLKKNENVPNLEKDFMIGLFTNMHPWSSGNAVKEPHFHVHAPLFNFVISNGEYIRFTPYISKTWLEGLKRIWKEEVRKAIYKIGDLSVWIDPYVFVDHEFFTVYSQYTWLDLDENDEFVYAGKIAHHFRYNGRKAVVDLNEAFYSGIKEEELGDFEREWIDFLLNYSNRTGCVGFMNKWRERFGITDTTSLKRAARERVEYCPICGRELTYCGVVTIDEILKKKRRLMILWYYNLRFNIEIWTKT
ncbi:hypothetical protein DRP05_01065 [Archaeoglobales archaeon]|nr:MAG: hypothetical protein DRP05_01065 [Archaeoglobales archaeon]